VSSFAAAADDAVAHVIVDDVDANEITVSGDDGHHLERVRRLRVDDVVTAADGRGAWRSCRVRAAADGRVVLASEGPVTLEPALVPALTVAFAPAKGDHAATVVHQLVELGVDAVMPVMLARSVVRWQGDRLDRALDRLRRVAREAAMQSRRARLPEVLVPEPLGELARRPGLVVADPTGGPPAALPEPPEGGWVVLVGPEGGLDPAERRALGAAPRLGVGPHVLRAVTAPVAAAAALAGFRSAEPAESTSRRPGSEAGPPRSARAMVDKRENAWDSLAGRGA
jgi:16S rRNA (uracil1498-N3)-methyltransferase